VKHKQNGAHLRKQGAPSFFAAVILHSRLRKRETEGKKIPAVAGGNDTLFHVSERLAATAESARR
jgi:hypothetical protein